ncbi:serine-rich adhesin for platelets-like [Aricia agestis]|uniref:serine-rich adhesin for platelets-like n=1 Tax=Aricia agestis TaxID=91739 RepID=UPI001C202EC5|nr:serine-rich adhesin for platelets-like [Aricia agestis]
MCPKMWEFVRITLVCVCALLLVHHGFCDDERSSEVLDDSRTEDQSEKTFRASIPGSRRTTTQSSNATRDSQLYSLLAARRRQLLTGRLTTHINTIATLAHKPYKGNTTFAQLEIRDANSSVVKRITFENSSNEAIAPTLKLITREGNKETRRDLKPHEIRQFIPRPYQDIKSRAGFLNNRKRDFSNRSLFPETTTESVVIYVPPEKLEGLDKEVEIDPEEEFQVDESNHGLYLLNYSDTDNVTRSPVESNKTTSNNEIKDNVFVESTTMTSTEDTTQITTQASDTEKEDRVDANTIANSTSINNTKLIKIEDKENANQTLFMSEEIYNHFRPLETELPDEEMAPFIYFGQKLGGSIISDSLTNSPSISASTKSVNFIAPPIEKRKFNSRYSATEKYKNNSAGEEEINEDMDISVIKNVIEKNKIRNTVKGPAPARHVGLVNAYRKFSSTTQSTAKPTTPELNVTEGVTHNETSSTEKSISDHNLTEIHSEALVNKLNITSNSPDTNVTESVTVAPKNFTRTYTSLRRRPSKLTTLVSTENTNVENNNSTTEKAATSVYTAVVTSVSITSSVKGQNKTDNVAGDNSTNVQILGDLKNITEQKLIVSDNETITSTTSTTTYRPYRHRFRIKTSTTENSISFSPNPTIIANLAPDASSVGDKSNNEYKHETTTFKISERIATTFKSEIENTPTGFTLRPKRRRRPTTTTTTTSTSTFLPFYLSSELTTPIVFPTTEASEIALTTVVITSRSASESKSKSHTLTKTGNETDQNDTNTTHVININEESQNEEVLIEAEKTYTASYVLAGLGFLPVIAVVAFVFRNLLKKKTKEIDAEYEGYFDDGGDIKKESPITPVARPPLPTPSKPDQKWEFPRNKLRLQTLLGQGNFGQVWKAEADDLTGHDGLTRLVAVKTIKESASQKEKQELLHEIYIMQKIGTHPNVVTLLGCCTEQEPYLLIMEYVMCGKLLTYLRERRSRPDRFSGSGALTSRDLTVFAYCVARGMDYIASKGIVHRDLAARNVLVDHNKLCKIADFGMSRMSGAGGRARGALPVRWMAPEALLYGSHSTHTDVWAFGILLWEIVTLGSTPYAAMSGREVLTAVTEGYRLERPTHCAPALYRAMSSCWHADPSQRPTFTSLKAQLAELLDNEPAEGNYVDLESFYQESSVYSDPSAIIHDDDGLSAEYDRERRCFRELRAGPAKFDNRAFNLRDEELRSKFGVGTQRMGGFGIRDGPFNDRSFGDGEFNDRNFTDKNFGERNFVDKNFGERNFADKNFNDPNFVERKDGKLSTSSFHRERERENPLVSRNSFNGFPRLGTRENHFQMSPDGRNKRVSEFECDI